MVSNGGKRQGPQSGSTIFEEMLHQGLLHNAITYSAVISACGKGITAVGGNAAPRCPAEGSGVREPGSSSRRGCAKASGQKGSVTTLWSCMREGCAAAESLAAPRGNAAPRQGLRPDGITYSDLVSACGQGTQPQRALQLLEVMWHQGILPDRIPYNALVSACGQGTQPQRALQLFETMRHQASCQTGSPSMPW